MKEKEWKPIVLADAARRGICRQYTGLLEKCENLTDFLRLYRRGADWALTNDVPSLNMLRRFAEERLDLHGIYVDKAFDGETLWDRQVYILRNCHGTIRTGLNIDKRIIPIFYIADGSDITIESANGDYLLHPVRIEAHLYGNSNVNCEDTKKLQCTKYK